MKVLLHVCCGPCTVYPLTELRKQGHEVSGYFFNPNIHPFREFKRRIKALLDFSVKEHFKADIDRNYGLTEYLRQVVFHENRRCAICYDMRLERAAERAAAEGFDAFTSTLLYSKYQDHAMIKRKAEAWAEQFPVRFLYQDFRLGWQQGIEQSIAMELYRQPYCGCIYSEQERYDKKMRKNKSSAE